MRQAQRRMDQDCSIIALDRFIQATRDSGYKGTASAISELVDNSIQANATRIDISVIAVSEREEDAIEISVLDNGCGMSPFTLRQALRFGGSTRFGDRSGLGRYGMGLPNASLSQARRVSVWTWQKAVPVRQKSSNSRSAQNLRAPTMYQSYLDVDEIVSGALLEVPRPVLVKDLPAGCTGPSGTLVSWTRCDRLDNRRVSTTVRKLEAELGRRFRHFLWRSLRITINGKRLASFDPLYLSSHAEVHGARVFGEDLRYEVSTSANAFGQTAWVRVRFSELPVDEWHKLPNDEKRRLGISKGAGVSVIRAGREVDYGWFFMGTKHRENYDDWWRCEIHFEPELDEAFGITHTKQQIRPQAHLLEALTPDIELTARVLNGRARKAHLAVKSSERFSAAEWMANERDHLLPPLPSKAKQNAEGLMRELERRHPILRRGRRSEGRVSRYSIVEAAIKDMSFFTYVYDGDRLVLVLNPDHPFYRDIYQPLSDSAIDRDQQLRTKLELLLLAAARCEAATRGKQLAQYRLDWSNTLATFLND
jgi:Histidine kinase-, DNA gyrase B-, and HSP90-like ATPase